MKTLKKRLTQCLLPILAGVVMGMGCGEDDLKNAPIEVEVKISDTLMSEKQSFVVGEDIVFSYKIFNKSNKDLVWYLNDEFNLGEIFTVYKIIPPNNENSQSSIVKVGTPQSGVFNIDFKEGHLISSNESIEFTMSWKGDQKFTTFFYNWYAFANKNNQLSIGDYFVEFEQSIDFAGFDKYNVGINIPFSIIEN